MLSKYRIAGNFYCKKDKQCHWCKHMKPSLSSNGRATRSVSDLALQFESNQCHQYARQKNLQHSKLSLPLGGACIKIATTLFACRGQHHESIKRAG